MNQVSTFLVPEIELGSARGTHARIKQSLDLEVVRTLSPEDLPSIQSPPPVAAGAQLVRNIRHSHHRLAELIAAGRPGQEISLITGYSPSYISNLQTDPAFAELIAYYEHQKKSIFIDAMERLKLLGLDAIEKLHERLDEEGRTWSNKELMDLVDMAAVQPAVAKHQSQAPGPSANLNLEVKFVGACPPSGSPVLDVNFTDITPNK